MNRMERSLLSIAACLLLAAVASADTLELKDGRVLEGRYLGGTMAVLRFEVKGAVHTYPVNDIVALTFTRGSKSAVATPAQPSSTEAAQVAPAAMAPAASTPAAAPATHRTVVVPAGQPLLVRMIDSVDSSKNSVGDLFHASLETDLTVNGTLVARKGADVYGRLATAKSAGKLAGSSELQLELTRIVIDGRDYPVVSSDYNVQGKGRGADTAKKVGGGAALGAIIGAIAGGGKGAAVGAGVGSAAGAGVQIITHGQQVKVPSETLLEFRLQQAVTVTPTAK
jgi:hypothetical protein